MKIIDIDLQRRRISLSIKQAAEGGEVADEYREAFGEHAYDEQGNYIGFDYGAPSSRPRPRPRRRGPSTWPSTAPPRRSRRRSRWTASATAPGRRATGQRPRHRRRRRRPSPSEPDAPAAAAADARPHRSVPTPLPRPARPPKAEPRRTPASAGVEPGDRSTSGDRSVGLLGRCRGGASVAEVPTVAPGVGEARAPVVGRAPARSTPGPVGRPGSAAAAGRWRTPMAQRRRRDAIPAGSGTPRSGRARRRASAALRRRTSAGRRGSASGSGIPTAGRWATGRSPDSGALPLRAARGRARGSRSAAPRCRDARACGRGRRAVPPRTASRGT